MAMTKKEGEYVEQLEKELRIRSAFRWTGPVPKDVPVPDYSVETSGFVYNAHSHTVSPAWSSSVCHGIGYSSRKDGHGASQRGIPLYSTRLLALKGLRHEVVRIAATDLAKIDAMIATEMVATQQANTEQSE